jgi:hypothetical protein
MLARQRASAGKSASETYRDQYTFVKPSQDRAIAATKASKNVKKDCASYRFTAWMMSTKLRAPKMLPCATGEGPWK